MSIPRPDVVDRDGRRWWLVPFVPSFGERVWMSDIDPLVTDDYGMLERIRGPLREPTDDDHQEEK